MKRYLPSLPGRLCALLGLFVVATVSGWSESRVWVQYASGAKGAVMSALKGANGRVHYEFDNINAVAVSLPEQAVAGLSRNPQVVLVEEDPIRVMSGQTTPYGVDLVKARDLWDSNKDGVIDPGATTGAGIVVGVIDSGVYRAHGDLPGAKLSGYPDFGASDERTWYRDFSSHGTHVVGTIAAVNNTEGVVGVAPGVDSIYMVKVFGDTGNWVYSSTLLAAVQNAVNSGHANIVSMSLGGSLKSRTEENGLNNIYNNGVLLVAAAGNDGNTRTSYPAGYSSVISVAAVAENKSLASFSQRNSTVELAAPGVGVLSTTSYIANTTVAVGSDVINAVPVEYAAYDTRSGLLVDGGLGDSQNPAWLGKVVLVQRGNISFYDKVRNVQLSGGVACVIYNNVEESLYATLGAGNSSTIPAVGLSLSQGNHLLANRLNQNATVTSQFTQPAAGYDYFDGTSMATPHVSGVAALIWSKYPSATNAQVRQAMIETAEDLGDAGRDTSFGYGLVQANDALARLGQLVGGGGGGGGGGDPTPPVIGDITGAPAKGKAGTFAISFSTNEVATCVTTVYIGTTLIGTATTGPSMNHGVKVQGTIGETYSGTVTATDAAGNSSAPKGWSYTNN